MAGRSRGRGGMKGGFNKALADQLGIQKSELVKENTSYTPETFPPLQFKPEKKLERNDLDNYKLMVKREIREHFRNSEYFITLDNKKPDIERYSDRFHFLNNKPRLHLDWSRYPKQLWYEEEEKERKMKKKMGRKAKVNLKCARSKKMINNIDIQEKLSKIKDEEEDEDEDEDEDKKDKKKEKENEESVADEEEDLDQDMDEGTDYMNSHFDNGESYVDDDDDNLEEAVCY